MYLKRFAYPCRYGDLVYHFARPVPEISIITNHIMDLIYGRWHHLLTRYNHDLLSPPKLLQYAEEIEQAGAAQRALDWTTSTRLSTSTSFEFQTSDVVGALALHVGFR